MNSTRQLSSWIIVVVAVGIGLMVGFGIGYMNFQPRLTDAQVNETRLETLLSSTNDTLSAVELELEETLADLDYRTEQNLLLNTSKAQLEDDYDKMRAEMEQVLSKLENDRELLIYLGMDSPNTRQRAQDHWQSVRNVAVESDSRLGFLVDDIIYYTDGYFDVMDTMPGPGATEEEINAWILEWNYSQEVFSYMTAITDFIDEAYLVIINHIEDAVNTLPTT